MSFGWYCPVRWVFDDGGGNGAETRVAVLASKDWHFGVIGIVAAKLAQEHLRIPTLIITLDKDGGEGRGSGRSVDGVDLGGLTLAAQGAGILQGGGHKQACGFRVRTVKPVSSAVGVLANQSINQSI